MTPQNMMPVGGMHSALYIFLICTAIADCGAQAPATQPVVRVVITSLRTADTLSNAAAVQTSTRLQALMGSRLRLVPPAQINAIVSAAYGQASPSQPVSAADLRQIGTLVRAGYIVDVTVHAVGSVLELSALRIGLRDTMPALELPLIHGRDIGAVAQSLAAQLAADTVQKRP